MVEYVVHTPSLALEGSLLLMVGRENLPIYRVVDKLLGVNSKNLSESPLPDRFQEHLGRRGWPALSTSARLLYLFTRFAKPQTAVETGVAFGESTAAILCAMNENSIGHLYSIDLPPSVAFSTESKTGTGKDDLVATDGAVYSSCWRQSNEVGQLVPEYLKPRWTLVEGNARSELPRLLDRLGNISFFLHDSLHTMEHMMFEFRTAWPHISEKGVLISHDYLWNKALLSFSKEVRGRLVTNHCLGFIAKDRAD